MPHQNCICTKDCFSAAIAGTEIMPLSRHSLGSWRKYAALSSTAAAVIAIIALAAYSSEPPTDQQTSLPDVRKYNGDFHYIRTSFDEYQIEALVAYQMAGGKHNTAERMQQKLEAWGAADPVYGRHAMADRMPEQWRKENATIPEIQRYRDDISYILKNSNLYRQEDSIDHRAVIAGYELPNHGILPESHRADITYGAEASMAYVMADGNIDDAISMMREWQSDPDLADRIRDHIRLVDEIIRQSDTYSHEIMFAYHMAGGDTSKALAILKQWQDNGRPYSDIQEYADDIKRIASRTIADSSMAAIAYDMAGGDINEALGIAEEWNMEYKRVVESFRDHPLYEKFKAKYPDSKETYAYRTYKVTLDVRYEDKLGNGISLFVSQFPGSDRQYGVICDAKNAVVSEEAAFYFVESNQCFR